MAGYLSCEATSFEWRVGDFERVDRLCSHARRDEEIRETAPLTLDARARRPTFRCEVKMRGSRETYHRVQRASSRPLESVRKLHLVSGVTPRCITVDDNRPLDSVVDDREAFVAAIDLSELMLINTGFFFVAGNRSWSAKRRSAPR